MQAVKDSGLDFSKEDPYRCGVIIGSGIGGLNEFEEQHSRLHAGRPGPHQPVRHPEDDPQRGGRQHLDPVRPVRPEHRRLRPPAPRPAHAIGDAAAHIQWDYADVMRDRRLRSGHHPHGPGRLHLRPRPVACATTIRQAASRPFDKDRDGFVLSEGAGIVVLEELEHARKRGATIYAEVLGCGSTADAHHITAPHPEGDGAATAMQLALQDARLNPARTSSTSTPTAPARRLGDEAETQAIKEVFGAHARKLGHQQHQEHARPSAGRLRRRRADRHCLCQSIRTASSIRRSISTLPTRPAISITCPNTRPRNAASAAPSPTASASADTTACVVVGAV